MPRGLLFNALERSERRKREERQREEERKRKEEEERRKEREEQLALARETGKQPLEIKQKRDAGFTAIQIREEADKERAAKERMQRGVRESDALVRRGAELTDPFQGRFAGSGATGPQRTELARPFVLPSGATKEEVSEARDVASRTERGIKVFQSQAIQARKDRLEDEARQAREDIEGRIPDPQQRALFRTKQITAAQAQLTPPAPPKPPKPSKDPLKEERGLFEAGRNRAKAGLRQQWRNEVMQGLGIAEQAANAGVTPQQVISATSGLSGRINALVKQKERDFDFETQFQKLNTFPENPTQAQLDEALSVLQELKRQLQEEMNDLQREVSGL